MDVPYNARYLMVHLKTFLWIHGNLQEVGVQSSQILPRQDFQKDSVASEMKVYFTCKNESNFPGKQSRFSQLMHKLLISMK